MPEKVAPRGPTKTPVAIQFEYDVWHAGELALFARQTFAYELQVAPLPPDACLRIAPFRLQIAPEHLPVVDP